MNIQPNDAAASSGPPLRILHIIFAFVIGGAETMLVDIVNRQVAQGHDVGLLIVNNLVDPALLSTVDRRVRVALWHRKPGSFAPALALRLNIFVRRYGADVIHIHDMKLAGLIRGLDRKLVYTVHDLNLPQRYLRPTILQAAITEAVRDDVLRQAPKSNVEVVSNGIDISRIAMRQEGRLPSGEFRIVQSGRLLYSKKGQDILIRALARLRTLMPGMRFTVDFLGDGPDRRELAELAQSLGVASQVRFTGALSRSKVYAAYAGYDMMVHPARFEGFGLIVAEAMAAGLPVAVPDKGGPAEVVGNGRYGTLFACDSHEACAEAIAAVASDYQKALLRAGEARRYALANYSLDAMVDKYIAIYRRLTTINRL